MKKPDIVYIVGPFGDHNPELRYSLRSVAANIPHRKVWIAGHMPTWVRNVGHIVTHQVSKSKYTNAFGNLLAALRHPDVADELVLFNDDFFAMRPLRAVPVRHRGTFDDMLRAVRYRTTNNADYMHHLYRTSLHLRDLGVDEPLSYELHVPLPMNKAAAAEILCRYEVDDQMAGAGKRSLYGNLAGIGGEQMADVRPLRQGFWEWDWISSNDQSFKPGLKTRQYVEHRFPRPGPYEDPGGAPVTRTTAFVCAAKEEYGGGRIKVLSSGDGAERALVDAGWLPV